MMTRKMTTLLSPLPLLPPMPLLTITSPATIQKCKSFRLRPSDIFICSYPKSGTTWTQHIVVSLVVADRQQQQQQQQQRYQPTSTSKGQDSAAKQQQQQQQEQEERGDCGDKYENIANSNNSLSYNHISDFAPFFEIDAHWEEPHTNNNGDPLAKFIRDNHDRLKRRIFNTHLRWDMLPKEGRQSTKHDVAVSESSSSSPSPLLLPTETEATTTTTRTNTHPPDANTTSLRPACGKFIYVTRNLPDVCASFYHHLSNQKEGTYIGNFTMFFRDWMDGHKIPFGSPLHHLLSFAGGFCDNQYSVAEATEQQCSGSNMNQSLDSPLLLLSYEKMKTNLRQEVLKIIDFLQLDNISMQVLEEQLLPTFRFQFMKENAHLFQPKSVTWLNGFQFLRRGEIGDGTKMLTMETTTVNAAATTTTTTTADVTATNATTESRSNEEAEAITLMDMFRNWVDREEYCQKISELESRGLTKETSEQFLAVVHGVGG